MNARKRNDRKFRRVLFVGLGLSAAVHGLAMGASVLRVPGPTAESAERLQERPSRDFQVQAVQLVELVSEPEPTIKPQPAEALVAAAAPARAQSAAVRAADPISPAPAAQSEPVSEIESLIAALGPPAAPSMRANFGVQQAVFGGNVTAAVFSAADSHEGHDHGAEEEDGPGWWGRLKGALGAGSEHCEPRKPPVLRPPQG